VQKADKENYRSSIISPKLAAANIMPPVAKGRAPYCRINIRTAVRDHKTGVVGNIKIPAQSGVSAKE